MARTSRNFSRGGACAVRNDLPRTLTWRMTCAGKFDRYKIPGKTARDRGIDPCVVIIEAHCRTQCLTR